MFDLTALPPDLVQTLDWRLTLPALAMPAALALAFGIRQSAFWLGVRLRLLSRGRYQVLHRPPLPVAKDGDRVEHVVLTPQGVFLIQIVSRRGRIAGKMEDKVWAEQTRHGSTAFHNPLRVGRRRAAVVAAVMGIDPDVLHPVVVFAGGGTFEQPMADYVTDVAGCFAYIDAQTDEVLDADELGRIRNRLEAGLDDPRWQAQAAARPAVPAAKPAGVPATAATAAGPVCPRCGSALGAYSYKTGARAGQMFSGCTRFPACGYRAYPVRKKPSAVKAHQHDAHDLHDLHGEPTTIAG